MKNLTGSELATLDAAKYFIRQGYKVIICCFEYGPPLSAEISKQIKVINILENPTPKIHADILWGNHWPVMTKLLSAQDFSVRKIVHLSMSPYEPSEQEPAYAQLLSKRLANSWETRLVRSAENPGLDIEIFNNSVTPDFLSQTASQNAELKKLAIVSNHETFIHDELFRKFLESRGVECKFFGNGAERKILKPSDLLGFDAVVSIGRTVQYALALGMPVFCYDRFGGPGYILLNNWDDAEKMNYSGRNRIATDTSLKNLLVEKHDALTIARRLIDDYKAALRDVAELQKIAKQRYDLFRNMETVLRNLDDARISPEIINEKYGNEIAAMQSTTQKASDWFRIKREIKRIIAQIENLFHRPRPTPRFGVSFVVYDGEELLEKSLRNIRPFVDYVNIVYSERSYFGDIGNPQITQMCNELQEIGLADEVIKFESAPIGKNEPARSTKRTAAEIQKRNVGLAAAKRAGMDYFMTMDTDEFYDAGAVLQSKQKILNNPDWTHTFVHILNYGRQPTQLCNARKWEYYVPYFSKLGRRSKLQDNRCAPCLTDGTRCLGHRRGANYRVLEDIFMHHYTRVRKELDKKYIRSNVSSRIDDDWLDSNNFITVPDYFELRDIAN